jgi:hypothetical protein
MHENLAKPANCQGFERLICALYEKKFGMTATTYMDVTDKHRTE